MAGRLTAVIEILGRDRSGQAFSSAMRNSRRMVQEVTTTGRIVERTTSRMQSSMHGFMRFLGQQVTGALRSFFYGIRMGVVGAGVAVAGFVATSVKSFRDFDKKLRETTALIAGANTGGKAANLEKAFADAEKQYKSFYKNLLRMAPQMRKTPQELAGGLYELVQAGLKGPAAMRLLKPAAIGATAGGGDVGSSARVMVQIMNALKMRTGQPGAGKVGGQVMDKIFQAINLGIGVDFPTMATSIGKFIGGAGVTFRGGRGKQGMRTLDELLSTYIFSTQQGARTADVGVGIQDVIKTIANPSVKSNKFAKSIGLDLNSNFLRQHGFVGSLTTIIQKMKDAGYTGAKLNDAIGKLFADVRGRRIVQYAANLNMVKTAMDSMGVSAGASSRSFQEQAKSLDAAMQTFKVYWETLKISLGGAAAPLVRSGMDRITGVLDAAGVTGRGQELAGKYEDLRGGRRRRFLNRLTPEDRVSMDRARAYNKAGLGGRIRIIADQAMTSFQAWWNAPQTQSKFTQAINSMIQRSFEMMGRMIRTIPSVYKFGRRLAGEIVRGVVDGIKDSVKGAFGMGGKGGGGFGGFGVSKDPMQAIAMTLLGGAFAKSRFGGSAMQRGVGVGGGALIAGLDPMTSAMLGMMGIVSGVQRNRRNKAAEAAATAGGGVAAVAEMRIEAATVNLTGRVVNMLGGGGGTPTLQPGYTSFKNKRGQTIYRGPKGFVSKAEAFGTNMPMVVPGGPAPKPPGPGPVGSTGRLGRLRGMFGGRMSGGAGTMAMTAAMAAPSAMSGQWGAAAGSVLGAATFFIPGVGPAIALPAAMAGGVLGGMAQDYFFGGGGGGGSKDQSAFDRLMGKGGPQAPVQTIPGRPGSKASIGGRGSTKGVGVWGGGVGAKTPKQPLGGFAAAFGPGGGFNVDAVGRANIAGFAKQYYHTAKAYYRAIRLLMVTPFDKEDLAASRFEKAAIYGASSQGAMDLLQQVSQEWQNRALEWQTARADRLRTAKAASKTVSTHERPAPRDRNKPSKTYEAGLVRNLNTRGIWKNIDKEQAKQARATGNNGPKSFKTGFDEIAKTIPEQMRPTITSMVGSITGVVNQVIGGTGGTAGPSSGAPPAVNATGGRTDAGSGPGLGSATRSFNASTIRGEKGLGPEIGNAMGNAGADMAKKMANHAADAITKKQLEGPMGGAYKALSWLYRQVGKPYIWGGGHPPNANLKGYDCSGLSSTALMVAGSKLAGTTFTMLPNTSPGAGLIQLGFNDPVHPSHMGINVLGKWFEARGHATPILGPGKARTNWAYTGVPKFHHGGVYDSNSTRGEGPAVLKDGEMVVRGDGDGGLQAHPVLAGGGFYINGPLIGHAEIRNAGDVHRVAQELVDLLERKRANSITAGTQR